jgi:hypothetical protein
MNTTSRNNLITLLNADNKVIRLDNYWITCSTKVQETG